MYRVTCLLVLLASLIILAREAGLNEPHSSLATGCAFRGHRLMTWSDNPGATTVETRLLWLARHAGNVELSQGSPALPIRVD
jgi:hypothetical protein